MIVKLNLDTNSIYRVIKRKEHTLILDAGQDDLVIEVPRRVCEIVPPCVTVVMLDEIKDTTEGALYPAYPVKANKYLLKNDFGQMVEVDNSSVSVVQEGLSEQVRGKI